MRWSWTWVVIAIAALGCDDVGEVADAAALDAAALDAAALDAGSGERTRFDGFTSLADPYLPARRLPGEVHLSSSRAPEPVSGFDNMDWSSFVRIDGAEAVLLEEDGPGVVTRMWFTFRLGDMGMEVADTQRLHFYVDGAEIELGDDARGVTLGELTSGELAAFPRPWVAGRDLSSDAHQLFVPIHFDRSIRITLDVVPTDEWVAYYHVGWRRLPDTYRVRSFDGALSPAEEAALLAASDLWVERLDGPVTQTEEELVLAPGASGVVDLEGPAVLREVAFEMIEGTAVGLEGALEVDGETVVDAPLRRWMHAASFAEPFASALASRSPSGGAMGYPAPVRTRASLTLRNTGAEPVTVRARWGYDPGSPPDGLGALRVTCGAPTESETGGTVALLEVTGRRGHYAGQWLVLRGREWGWSMMEGDHEVWVDGEPRLLGTGIEDYFGGAFYYLAGPFALPFVGAPGYDLMGRAHLDANPIDVAQYRHHLLDTVAFEGQLAFEYEVTAPNTVYEHCSFWYLDPPG